MTSLSDCRILANGVKMPCIGFGTWQTPDGDVARESVRAALAQGYRHIDTAAAYFNETTVGEGIRASGVKREDIFLTTKQWVSERGYEATIAAAEQSLKRLGVDYLDLYLIHWPCVAAVSPDWEKINESTWRGFEKLVRDGKIRAIGVSNFNVKHLEALWKVAEIKPMVDQVEFHPGFCQREIVDWCQAHGVQVEAWSPLGSGNMLSNPLLARIAAAHGKSVAQVCIRYSLQNGVVPLPKSVHAERIAANADVFDFELTAAELAEIDAMPQASWGGFDPELAPGDAYQKSLEK